MEPAKMTAAKARRWAANARANGETAKADAWDREADRLATAEAGVWRDRADLA